MTGRHRIDPRERPYAVESLPTKPEVGLAGFDALDLRVGRVTAVEDFPEARKPSWKVAVDFGPVLGTRWTSAQIRDYDRAELVGRQVVGAVNLGSRRIAGFRSEFLILGGLAADGRVHLLAVDADLPPGSVVA